MKLERVIQGSVVLLIAAALGVWLLDASGHLLRLTLWLCVAAFGVLSLPLLLGLADFFSRRR